MDNLLQVCEFIKNNDNFIIITHKYPDGDALGSSCAMSLCLKELGKKSKIVIAGDLPSKYIFMEKYMDNFDFDNGVVLSVDLADKSQLDDSISCYKDNISLCIDHHITNKIKANVSFVDSGAASTCEIIYQIIKKLGINITKDIAECLYVGISTDTGCFKYSNVTAKTHIISAELIDAGIDLPRLNRILFDTKSKKIMDLEMMVYNSLEYFFGNRCAIAYVTCDILEKLGIEESEVEGIASMTRSIEGVKLGITIREKNHDFCKVSVRSTPDINSAKICEYFGGGGHSCAAGFSFYGTLEDIRGKLLEYMEKNLVL